MRSRLQTVGWEEVGSLHFLQAGREAESSYMQVEGGYPGCGQNRLCVYCAAGFKQVVVTV